MVSNDSWRILYVEDDPDLPRQVEEALRRGAVGSIELKTIDDFAAAAKDLENRRYDLLILDLFAGLPAPGRDHAGVRVLEHLKQVRFTPTIFYTALPNEIEGPESPFVKVVGKEGGGLKKLVDAVKGFVDSGLLELNRGLSQHIEKIQRDYMQDFVSPHWAEFAAQSDKRALAYLLARRLAVSLSTNYVGELAQILGESTTSSSINSTDISMDVIHRMQAYIIPPIAVDFQTGDILQGEARGESGYWVVLTPSCDLVTDRKAKNKQTLDDLEVQPNTRSTDEKKIFSECKAEYVHLAYCEALIEFDEYKHWKAEPEKKRKREQLEALLRNSRTIGQCDRYHYLPGVFDMPHLVVDFQKILYIPYGTLGTMIRKASLDSPYAESLLSRYNRYYARIGTPDLNLAEILTDLGE